MVIPGHSTVITAEDDIDSIPDYSDSVFHALKGTAADMIPDREGDGYFDIFRYCIATHEVYAKGTI